MSNENDFKILELQAPQSVLPDGKEFLIVANTGNLMRAPDGGEPIILDFEGIDFVKEETPILYSHDHGQPIGVTTWQKVVPPGSTAEVNGKTFAGPAVLMKFKFTNSGETASSIRENLENGFRYEASVGTRMYRIEELPEGCSEIVNGMKVDGPARITRRSSIQETSICLFGACPDTKVLNAKLKGGAMEKELSPAVPKAPEAEKAEVLNAAAVDERVNAVKMEFEEKLRRNSIEACAASFRNQELGQIEFGQDPESAVCFKTVKSAANYALKNGLNVEEFQLALLNAATNRPVGPSGPAIHSKNNEVTTKVAQAALLKAYAGEFGIPLESTKTKRGTARYGLEAWFSDQELEAADRPNVRNISLHGIYRTLYEQVNGFSWNGSTKSDEFLNEVGRAMTAAKGNGGVMNFSHASPISLSYLFGDSAKKILLAAAESEPTTYQNFVQTVSVDDFKETTLMGIESDNTLAPVGNNGVIEHGTMRDSSFTVHTDTFAKMYGATRKQLINDDVGGIFRAWSMLGRSVPKTIEQLFYWTILSKFNTLFTAEKGNLLQGAEYVLSIDALRKVSKSFREKVGFDGQPLSISPDRILTGIALEELAQDIYSEKQPILSYFTGNVDEIRIAPQSNRFKGRYVPTSSAYLDNPNLRQTIFKETRGQAFPNQSENLYFVSTNPGSAEGAAFYLVCLGGDPTPTVTMFDESPETLGTGIRVVSDFNICPGKVELMTAVLGE